jgi:hypothetical protein
MAMTEPWQMRHDLIRANEAAFARDARRAAHLATLRSHTRQRRRLRLVAVVSAVLKLVPRRKRPVEVAPAG